MSSSDPKSLAARWFHDLWNRHDKATIHELMAPDAWAGLEGGEVTGPDELVQNLFDPMLALLPDIGIEVTNMISEGDDVASAWVATATAPDGTRFSFTGMTWMTFKDGKLVSGFDRFNLSGLEHFLKTGVPCNTVRKLPSTLLA